MVEKRKLAAILAADVVGLRRDNQDENRATIRMRMRRRGDYEGRAKPDRRNPRGGGERPGGLVWR